MLRAVLTFEIVIDYSGVQVSSLLMKLSVCRAGAEAEAAVWLYRWTVPSLERTVIALPRLDPQEPLASGASPVLHRSEARPMVRKQDHSQLLSTLNK